MDRDSSLCTGIPACERSLKTCKRRLSLVDSDETTPNRDRKIVLDDFDLLRMVGEGTFGKVILSREKSSQKLFAIKVLEKQKVLLEGQLDNTITECFVLRSISHPFIVALEYSFQTESRLFFVIEYINGGNLFFHMQEQEEVSREEETRFYSAEIILALGYLHERGIIHRDLKPENVLLDHEGHVKIADFGLCKKDLEYGSTTRTFCGTSYYIAPEVISSSPYGHAVDWWGLGVIMYEMMCGELPFDGDNDPAVYEEIRTRPVEIPPFLSSGAESVLRGLLTREPKSRLGGSERDSEEIKEHVFFRGMSWDGVLARELDPPFKPKLESDIDTRYFDPDVTKKKVKLKSTEAEPLLLWNSTSKEIERQHFKNFSFYGRSSPAPREAGQQGKRAKIQE